MQQSSQPPETPPPGKGSLIRFGGIPGWGHFPSFPDEDGSLDPNYLTTVCMAFFWEPDTRVQGRADRSA